MKMYTTNTRSVATASYTDKKKCTKVVELWKNINHFSREHLMVCCHNKLKASSKLKNLMSFMTEVISLAVGYQNVIV